MQLSYVLSKCYFLLSHLYIRFLHCYFMSLCSGHKTVASCFVFMMLFHVSVWSAKFSVCLNRPSVKLLWQEHIFQTLKGIPTKYRTFLRINEIDSCVDRPRPYFKLEFGCHKAYPRHNFATSVFILFYNHSFRIILNGSMYRGSRMCFFFTLLITAID